MNSYLLSIGMELVELFPHCPKINKNKFVTIVHHAWSPLFTRSVDLHADSVHDSFSELNADMLGVFELRHKFFHRLRVILCFLNPHNDWRLLETVFKDIL